MTITNPSLLCQLIRSFNLPPSPAPWAFELLRTGLFKFCPPPLPSLHLCQGKSCLQMPQPILATMTFYILTKLYNLHLVDHFY